METKQSLKVTGHIIWIGEPINGTKSDGSTWVKQSFLIESGNQYKSTIGFFAWGQQTEILSRCKIGDIVTIYFAPESRMHENRIFTELKAYGININFNQISKNGQANTIG